MRWFNAWCHCLLVMVLSALSGAKTSLDLATQASSADSMTIRCVCKTSQHICPGGENCTTTVGCFTSVNLEKNAEGKTEPNYHYGCTGKDTHHLLTCNTQPSHISNVQCCRTDMCNEKLRPTLRPTPQPVSTAPASRPPDGHQSMVSLALAIIIPLSVLALLIILIIFIFREIHRRRLSHYMNNAERNASASTSTVVTFARDLSGSLRAVHPGDSTLQVLMDGTLTSGSGSGLPMLVQRTIANHVTLLQRIGKGKYGDVWCGDYQGEKVAVKIFSSRDEMSWQRESEIYNTVLLRHENILGFLASDMTSRDEITQLWLITHYHENGSLYDYLQANVLDHGAMLRLLHSACAGLVHLHTEILGTQGKPAIAHRDVKSKNILVKRNGVCVIADLGLSVTHSQVTGRLDVGHNPKVGTKRYMAPELLDETMDTDEFDSYTRLDIYAFGLVMWEVARRCVVAGAVDEYQPPFYNVVPNDPSFEDMRKIVVIDQQRPHIPSRWIGDAIMSSVAQLMQECWAQEPAARLPLLRVRKNLYRHNSPADASMLKGNQTVRFNLSSTVTASDTLESPLLRPD